MSNLLLVDDESLDYELLGEALSQIAQPYNLHYLNGGSTLLDYLRQQGEHEGAPPTHLLLLDLNMPGRSGRALLTELKSDPKLRRLPVVIFTSSWSQADITAAYDLGANAVLIKPMGFDALIEMMQSLTHFWFQLAALPLTDTP